MGSPLATHVFGYCIVHVRMALVQSVPIFFLCLGILVLTNVSVVVWYGCDATTLRRRTTYGFRPVRGNGSLKVRPSDTKRGTWTFLCLSPLVRGTSTDNPPPVRENAPHLDKIARET